MSTVGKLIGEFRDSPMKALQRWERMRMPWFVMAGSAALMLAIASGYFQWYLELDPCELCVYTRFSMFCIVFAGLIIMIQPESRVLKCLGLLLAWYGVIQGMLWSVELEQLHIAGAALEEALAQGADLFAAGGGGHSCSMIPKFPLGLPLHEWFPFEFQPTGICGEDGWLMFGLNMAEYLIFTYLLYIVALAAGTIGVISNVFDKQPVDKAYS